MKVPMEVLYHILAPFESSEISDLEWVDPATKSKLKPTRVTDSFNEYRYVVVKPGQLNTLFNLGEWDSEIPGTKWKRGSGAQRLHLSQAAGQRGQTTTLISSVTGKVTVEVREYPDGMPNLSIIWHVSTMDEAAHIMWARDYVAATRAGLRKMLSSGLSKMVADALYPTGAGGVPQLTEMTDSVFQAAQTSALAASSASQMASRALLMEE
jgi:hypothetical protein